MGEREAGEYLDTVQAVEWVEVALIACVDAVRFHLLHLTLRSKQKPVFNQMDCEHCYYNVASFESPSCLHQQFIYQLVVGTQKKHKGID
jgi:hypothetical protein